MSWLPRISTHVLTILLADDREIEGRMLLIQWRRWVLELNLGRSA